MTTTSRLFPLLIGAGGLLIGALFIFLGTRLWKSSHALASSGVSADAIVRAKFRQAEGATWGGLEDTFVKLSYVDASGRPHDSTLKIASKVWRQLDEGGSFGISYLPSEPDRIFPHTVLAHKIRRGIAVVLLALGSSAAVLFPVMTMREFLGARREAASALPMASVAHRHRR